MSNAKVLKEILNGHKSNRKQTNLFVLNFFLLDSKSFAHKLLSMKSHLKWNQSNDDMKRSKFHNFHVLHQRNQEKFDKRNSVYT